MFQGIDPNASTPDRIRRNWANLAKFGPIATVPMSDPLALAGSPGTLTLNLNATTPCLSKTAGLGVTVNAAGALTKTATGLLVAVDGTTLEISSNAVRVKDGGITGAKLATGLTLPSFKVSEAANGRMGTVTLAAGVATVGNTSVAANTRIFLTTVTPGGTPGVLSAGTRVAGTSFTITSSIPTDTSTIAYLLIDPG